MDETDTLSSRDDMIIGRDLLEELGINFLFKEHLMEWDNASTPMLDPAVFNTEHIDDLEHEIQILLMQREFKPFSMQSIAKLT